MAFSILPQFSGVYDGNNAGVRKNRPHLPPSLQPDMSQPPAIALPAGAVSPWHRVMSTLAHVLGFGLVALALHEFFHLLVLQALGGEGFITFDMELGFTHFTKSPSHLWAVQLSGGLLTGAFLLIVFWFWAWSSRTAHNTNMEVAAFAWALGNLAYAPIEMVTSSPAVGAVSFGIGFSAAALLYFTRLMNWLAMGGCQAETAARPYQRWRQLNGHAGPPRTTLAGGGARGVIDGPANDRCAEHAGEGDKIMEARPAEVA